jgi:hypothetical protein
MVANVKGDTIASALNSFSALVVSNLMGKDATAASLESWWGHFHGTRRASRGLLV